MDTSGFSQVGRYGTLSLLKRRSASANGATKATTPTNDIITSFGIDSSELTFGSSSTCGVRLYYTDVDSLHCKIVFEDGKAFLAVLGKEGVLVDGCWIYPHTSSDVSSSVQEQNQQQTIIPLTNNSEFEIHNKRFKFTHPPKEVRKAMISTPAPAHKRALRLSMIHSAQVFSPRPSKDPRENLRILQSPLKGIFGTKTPVKTPGKTPSRTRAVSPLKYSSRADSDDEVEDKEVDQPEEPDTSSDDDDEDEIILVQTNHPRVVEEERDLVILEDVLIAPDSVQQRPVQAQPQVASQPQPPRTPRRKSMGGTALHRAVLIRSAQRAVWRAEKEREEEEEELEVLSAVVDPVEADDDSDEEDDDREEEGRERGGEKEWEDDDVEMRSVSSEDDETDEDEDEEESKRRAEQKPLWRKSLERIIPWPFIGKADEEGEEDAVHPVETRDKEHDEEVHEDEEQRDENQNENQNEVLAPLLVRAVQTPVRRVFGSFMTPQPQNQTKKSIFPQTQVRANMPPALPQAVPDAVPLPVPGVGRYSLGGGEARRVVVQQPWKVKDLVVPPIVPISSDPAPSSNLSPVRQPAGPGMHMQPPSTPSRAGPAVPRPTPVVTEEERKAIQERRRSAVLEFKADTFWKNGAPGMSPSKNSGPTSNAAPNDRRSISTSPFKPGMDVMQPAQNTPSNALASPRKAGFTSPTKGRALGYAIAEECDSMSLENDTKRNHIKRNPRSSEEADIEDTQSLLERMRETVEDMKRRRSMVASTPRVENASLAPTQPEPALASEASDAPAAPAAATPIPFSAALTTPIRATGPVFGMGSVKKIDFSRITPGPRAGSAKPPSRTKSPAPALADVMNADNGAEQDEPFSLLRPGARVMTPVRKPPSRDLRARNEVQDEEVPEVFAVPLPIVGVDIEDEDVVQRVKPKGTKTRGRSKALRATKQDEVENDGPSEEAEEAPPSKPKRKAAAKPRARSAKSPAPEVPPESMAAGTLAPATKRGRSKTPQPAYIDEEADVPTEAPAKATTARRNRRGAAEPEEPTPAPTRRGRKATVEPEELEREAEIDPAEGETKTIESVATKRGRKPRAAPVVPDEEPQGEVPALAPVKRSRSKKAAASVPVAVPREEDEDDELDSYDARPAASGSQIKSSIPVKATTKSRKKAPVVKQEPEEEDQEVEEPVPLVAARGGRAKANTAKTPAAAKTTGPSKVAKPRGRPKTPATAPAAVPAPRVPSSTVLDVASSEKENTPEAGPVSDDAEEAPVKVRVSRKTTAATGAGSGKSSKTTATKSAAKSTKSKVKLEADQEESEEVVPVKVRTTRVMRARTKTS